MTNKSVTRKRERPLINLGTYGSIKVVGCLPSTAEDERVYHVIRLCCGQGQAIRHRSLKRMIIKAHVNAKCCFCVTNDPRMYVYRHTATKVANDQLVQGVA